MTRFGAFALVGASSVAALTPGRAFAQGQALPSIKVNLPASPNFDVATAPLQYPTGEMSVFGLRKAMTKYLDKDVRVKGYLLEIYECPAEIRKCNDDLAAKAKKEHAKQRKNSAAPPAVAQPPAGGCRPCDQPHFFIGDAATTKIERALLVADYPVKDWNTGKPKPLVAKVGEQHVVTGTFAINSMAGFGASNGLLVHKKLEDSAGKVLAIGNAVLPAEGQSIQLEGKPAEPLLPGKSGK